MKNWSNKNISSTARPWILYPAGFFVLYGTSLEWCGETIQSEMAWVVQKDLKTYSIESGADYFFDKSLGLEDLISIVRELNQGGMK